MPPPDVTQARSALLGYYDQWRALSAAEGEAIRGRQWLQVQQLQESKRQLQGNILTHLRELPAEVRRRLNSEMLGLVEELITLEHRNREDLGLLRTQLELRQQQTEEAALRLRQIRQAYSSTRAVAWQSYS